LKKGGPREEGLVGPRRGGNARGGTEKFLACTRNREEKRCGTDRCAIMGRESNRRWGGTAVSGERELTEKSGQRVLCIVKLGGS